MPTQRAGPLPNSLPPLSSCSAELPFTPHPPFLRTIPPQAMSTVHNPSLLAPYLKLSQNGKIMAEVSCCFSPSSTNGRKRERRMIREDGPDLTGSLLCSTSGSMEPEV